MQIFTHDYWHVPLGPNQVDRATVAVRITAVVGIALAASAGLVAAIILDDHTATQQPATFGQVASSPRLKEFIATGLVCVGSSGEKFSVSLPVRDDSVLSDAAKCTLDLSRR